MIIKLFFSHIWLSRNDKMSHPVEKKTLKKNTKQNSNQNNSEDEPNIRITRSRMAKFAIDVAPQANAVAIKFTKKRKSNDGIVSQSVITDINGTNGKAERSLSDLQSHAWRPEDLSTAITKGLTKKYCDIGNRLGLTRIPKCLSNLVSCSKSHHQTVSKQQKILNFKFLGTQRFYIF